MERFVWWQHESGWRTSKHTSNTKPTTISFKLGDEEEKEVEEGGGLRRRERMEREEVCVCVCGGGGVSELTAGRAGVLTLPKLEHMTPSTCQKHHVCNNVITVW